MNTVLKFHPDWEGHFCSAVREFHIAFGCAAPTGPIPMDDQTRFARAQLVGEELSELLHGLAAGDLIECLDAMADTEYVLSGTIVATGYDRVHTPPHRPSGAEGPPRLPHPDAALVVVGTMYDGQSALVTTLAQNNGGNIAMIAGAMLNTLGGVWELFGIPEGLRLNILAEVHASNMTKFGADGKPVVNEAGRVVKGPNYRAPDILGVMKAWYGADYTPPAPRTAVTTPLSGGTR